MIMSQLDIMYLQYCVCICIYREMMMMMMMMMMMVDVVVLVISASDNRWGSLVGLGRGEIEGSTFFRVKRVCHSRSFAWSVGFVVLAVRWFYYVWLGRWEREIFRAMTRRAACYGDTPSSSSAIGREEAIIEVCTIRLVGGRSSLLPPTILRTNTKSSLHPIIFLTQPHWSVGGMVEGVYVIRYTPKIPHTCMTNGYFSNLNLQERRNQFWYIRFVGN